MQGFPYPYNPIEPTDELDELSGETGATPRSVLRALDQPLTALSLVVIDFETTGLYPNQGDEIVELGGVYIDGLSIQAEQNFSALVNPLRPVSPDAYRVHGIPDALLAEQPPLPALLPSFMDFIGNRVVVGQNIAFDLSFLVKGLERCRLKKLENPVLDTRWMSKIVDPRVRSHSLDAIAERLGLKRPADRHRALGDVMLTAEVLVRLLQQCEAAGYQTLRALLDRHQELEGGKHDDPGVRSVLERGFRAHQRVQIVYGPAVQGGRGSRPEQRDVDVYHLSPPYFLGYCHSRRTIRTFRIDRVAKAELLTETYSVPEGFDPRDHFLRWSR